MWALLVAGVTRVAWKSVDSEQNPGLYQNQNQIDCSDWEDNSMVTGVQENKGDGEKVTVVHEIVATRCSACICPESNKNVTKMVPMN